MSQQTPHDSLFKHIFSQPENAAGVLRAMVPPEMSRQIDWSTLRLEPGSFVDPNLKHSHTDLLFSARCGSKRAFIYVLFEHQSTGDELMAFRVLRYVVRIWEAFLRDNEGAKRLPAIVPIVLQHEPGGWKHATDLSSLLDLDPELVLALGDHLPRLRFVLDDLAKVNDDDLRQRALTAAATIGLLLFARARTSADLLADLGPWRDVLLRVVTSRNGVEALKAFLEYISLVTEIPPTDLRRFVHELGPAAEEAFMTTAQQLKIEGKAEILLMQLQLRFKAVVPESIAARVHGASTDELDHWAERILFAVTIDDLFA